MAKTEQPSRYSWTEPESDYKAKYPYNNVMQSESGHFLEFDDTKDSERIRLQHRVGTYTEIQVDGSSVNKIIGDNYQIVLKDNNVLISGACNITVEGDSILTVNGDCVQRIKGDFLQEIEGDYQQVVKGSMSITSKNDIDITAGSTTGSIYMTAPTSVDITSDLDVDGAIAGESITSRNEVTAGTGIHAGLPGSANPFAGISTLGGISAGFMTAGVPGTMTATVSVNAPLIAGIVVTDIVGPMQLIRLLYNTHTHFHSRGPGFTAMPIPMM